MKFLRKVIPLALGATTLLATNGTNLIGTSAVSRSMGGTGVAYFSSGAEAMHKNVSLMGSMGEKDDFQFDLTYFNAAVKSSVYDKMPLNANLPPLPNLPSYDGTSTAPSQNMIETNFIPSISYATRLNDKTVFGLAMIGAAGMAVNYKGDYAQRQLKSSMMLMKIIPAISYRVNNVNFGFAPVLGLGSMSLNYDEAYLDPEGNPYPYGTKPQSDRKGLFGTNVGGDELVPALGFQAGIDIEVTEKFRIGASYQSSLTYKYKQVANFSQFGPNGMVYMADEWMYNNYGTGLDGSKDVGTIAQQLTNAGMNPTLAGAIGAVLETSPIQGTIQDSLDATSPKNLDDLTLEQPWEAAIGFSYEFFDNMTITADYRYIAWALAKGYGDFGWENQSVYGVGLVYEGKKYVFRFGYNYADSPISNIDKEEGYLLKDVQGHLVFNQALSMLNMVGFPAISTTHFTFGMGMALNDDLDLDLSAVYSPETVVTRSGYLSPAPFGYDETAAIDMPYEYTTTMRQFSLSMGLNYQF